MKNNLNTYNEISIRKSKSWIKTRSFIPTEGSKKQGVLHIQAHGEWIVGPKKDSFLNNFIGESNTQNLNYIWEGVSSTSKYLQSMLPYLGLESSTNTFPLCKLDSCFWQRNVEECIKRGSIVDDYSPRPCKLMNGVGLIGAIANYPDNNLENPQYFFVHMDNQSPENIAYFMLKTNPDYPHPDSKETPLNQQSQIYLKMLDDNFENKGSYKVKLSTNSNKSYHFIGETLSKAGHTIITISKSIAKLAFNSWAMQTFLPSLLVLYIAIVALSFLLGLPPYDKETFVVTTLKICFLAILINPQVFFGCIEVAELLFIKAGAGFSQLLISSSLSTLSPYVNLPLHEMSTIEIYDKLIDVLLSPTIHIRILSLFFTKYIIFIPVIYIAIWQTIMAIINCIYVYLFSLITISIMLLISPIMVGLLFFKVPRRLFDNWLRAIIGSSLISIFISLIMAMVITLAIQYIFIPFDHVVCKEPLGIAQELSKIGLKIDPIYVWRVYSPSSLDPLYFYKWLGLLLSMLTLKKLVEFVPDMVEGILPIISYYPFANLNPNIAWLNPYIKYQVLPSNKAYEKKGQK